MERPVGICATANCFLRRSRVTYGICVAQRRPVCLAATAFALLHVLDAMEADGLRVSLPPGSRIMETGGFKGRSRMVSREELYERTCDRFGVDQGAVVAEYGMTELSSQYYDRVRVGAVIAAPTQGRAAVATRARRRAGS